MIPVGSRVLLATPGVGSASGHTARGIVRGLAPTVSVECWPGAEIYRVEIDGAEWFAIGALLTVIDRPAAAYAPEAGRA